MTSTFTVHVLSDVISMLHDCSTGRYIYDTKSWNVWQQPWSGANVVTSQLIFPTSCVSRSKALCGTKLSLQVSKQSGSESVYVHAYQDWVHSHVDPAGTDQQTPAESQDEAQRGRILWKLQENITTKHIRLQWQTKQLLCFQIHKYEGQQKEKKEKKYVYLTYNSANVNIWWT